MPGPAPPWPLHVVQLRHTVEWQDIKLSNVFHVAVGREPTPWDMDQLAAAIHYWWRAKSVDRPNVPHDWLPWSPGLGFKVVLTVAGLVPIPGLTIITRIEDETVRATSNVAFPGAAVLVQWDSTGRGHWKHGRSYFGPVRDSLLQGEPEGRLIPDLARLIGEAFSSLVPILSEWPAFPGLYHLVLRHARPHFPSDSPDGLYSRITRAGVRDIRLRRQGRRVPNNVLPR